jgi:predicted transcriptional regulator
LESEEVEKLFFELASESRLSILRELQKEDLKMQEIARRIDVTPTEAFRQLERLAKTVLVQRQPDGTFTLTQYGKLVLQISASLDLLSRHREYFSTHNLAVIPSKFLYRLGELSKAKLQMDTIEIFNRTEKWFSEAKQYIWAVGEGTIPEHMIPVMNQRVEQGIQLRMLIPMEILSAGASQPETLKNLETRGLSEIPAIIALTEKMAGVCFRQVGGRMDYVGFFGGDPVFHDWVGDLFLYYWEKAKQV